MKKSQFTEEQIAYALHQHEGGMRVAEVTCRLGISEQTFYRWKKKFGGLAPSEVRRLKELARWLMGGFGVNAKRACTVVRLSRSIWMYPR